MRYWRRSQIIQSKDAQTMFSAAWGQGAAKDIFLFLAYFNRSPFLRLKESFYVNFRGFYGDAGTTFNLDAVSDGNRFRAYALACGFSVKSNLFENHTGTGAIRTVLGGDGAHKFVCPHVPTSALRPGIFLIVQGGMRISRKGGWR